MSIASPTLPTTVSEYMRRANTAAAVFSQFDQQQTDRVVKAVYEAIFGHRVRLARMAAEETGLGRWQDKVIKNVVASQFVYEDIKDVKTVGIVHEDPAAGIVEIAQPAGPILAIIPVTNPTSTVIFKILIALKRATRLFSASRRGQSGAVRKRHVSVTRRLWPPMRPTIACNGSPRVRTT